MALLYVFEAKGDPADLLARYDQAGAIFREKAALLDRRALSPVIAHFCVETPDGIRIFDLLQSPELEADAPRPDFQRDILRRGQSAEWLQRHGLIDQAQRDAVRNAGLLDVNYSDTTYRVHDFRVFR